MIYVCSHWLKWCALSVSRFTILQGEFQIFAVALWQIWLYWMLLVTQANAKEMSSLSAVNIAAWRSLLTTEVLKSCTKMTSAYFHKPQCCWPRFPWTRNFLIHILSQNYWLYDSKITYSVHILSLTENKKFWSLLIVLRILPFFREKLTVRMVLNWVFMTWRCHHQKRRRGRQQRPQDYQQSAIQWLNL